LEPMCFPATGDSALFSAADSARSPSLSPGTAGWLDPFIYRQTWKWHAALEEASTHKSIMSHDPRRQRFFRHWLTSTHGTRNSAVPIAIGRLHQAWLIRWL